jgi:hypothetical protein
VDGDERLDHLPDRKSLAAIAAAVPRQEPIETEIGVVGTLLLGKQQSKSRPIGKTRPARAMIIARRCLRAAVQHDHKRRIGGQAFRYVRPGSQGAGIGAERGKFRQPVGRMNFLMTVHSRAKRRETPDRIP